jgi:hypothetical protein
MPLKLKLGIAAGVAALGIGGYATLGLMGLSDLRDYSKGVPQDAQAAGGLPMLSRGHASDKEPVKTAF